MKVRIIPTLLMRGTGLVKSVEFSEFRRVGSLLQALNVYRSRDVDELVFLDLDATRAGADPDLEIIAEVAQNVSVPLTVGGGVASVETAGAILRLGVEKVVLNSAAHADPSVIGELAAAFGSQSIVVGIDVRSEGGRRNCYSSGASVPTGRDPAVWAREVEALGAGEILLSAVERDGRMLGYDLDLLRSVTNAVHIPVIAACGAGSYADLRDAVLEGGASAVAAASIFHFTQLTPDGARRFLANSGIPVRQTWRPSE